jgi:3-isopropylmalate/(R)-2-methylmalate dehydratase small subunit
MGSSREQAVMALRHHGVSVVVAKSFAGLFFRNAVNLGLAPLVCPDAGTIARGDVLDADPATGRVENRTQGRTLTCEPIPMHLMAMLRDGGLIAHLEKKLKARAS